MDRRTYIIYIISAIILTSFMNFGCGKYVEQYSAPAVISRYPVLNGSSLISGETIWVKFSKKMNTDGYDMANVGSKFKFASDMTAVSTFYPDLTPEVVWTENDSRLEFRNYFFAPGTGKKVHIVASFEEIETNSSQFIPENTDLWDFDLTAFYIVTREPEFDTTLANGLITMEVTFNNSIETSSFSFLTGAGHTAGHDFGTTIFFPFDKRIVRITVSSWQNCPATVEMNGTVTDIYGNTAESILLWRYNINP